MFLASDLCGEATAYHDRCADVPVFLPVVCCLVYVVCPGWRWASGDRATSLAEDQLEASFSFDFQLFLECLLFCVFYLFHELSCTYM